MVLKSALVDGEAVIAGTHSDENDNEDQGRLAATESKHAVP